MTQAQNPFAVPGPFPSGGLPSGPRPVGVSVQPPGAAGWGQPSPMQGGGSAKPGMAGPMPPQQGPTWGGPSPQQGAPNLPPGYTYDPGITGGVTQTNPYTGFGAIQRPLWDPNYGAANAASQQAPRSPRGVPPGTPPGGPGGLYPTPGNGPGGAPNPAFPSGPLGPVPPQGGGQLGGIPTPGGNPLGAVPPQGGEPTFSSIMTPSEAPGAQSGGGMVNGIYYPPGTGPGGGGTTSSSGGQGGYQGGSSTPYGINPADVANPDPANAGNWQEFEDNAYAGFTRTLDPQWQERERQLMQDLSNRGIPQGSEAWTQALGDFNQGRNDAYGQARQQSQQAGLQAQNQFFGQNALESQLANALLRSQWDMDSRMAGIGAQNRATDAGLQQALASLGLQRDLGFGNMGLQRELGLYGVGLDYDRMGFARDQADFGNLMQMLNFGFGSNQYNNSLLDSDYNRGMGLFGMVPQVSPGQVDVTGPYGNAQNWAGFLQGNANQQQNGFYQGLGSLFQTLPYLFGQGGSSGSNIPSTMNFYGPQSGGYNYPSGGYGTPWTSGLNYGQGWPGG